MTTATESIINMVKQNGTRGYTAPEIQRDLSIPAGTATSRTSTLAKKGVIRWSGEKRDRSKVYVFTGGLDFSQPVTPAKVAIHYELLIDNSGSMDGTLNGRPKWASAFDLVEAQLKVVGDAYDIWTFSGRANLERARQLKSFGSDVGTPLYRTAAAAIVRAMRKDGPKVVFIFTDGEAFDYQYKDNFVQALARADRAGDVTVVFLVPEGSPGMEQLIQEGVPAGNIQPWKTIEQASEAAAAGHENLKQAVSRGARRTKTYFKADLSHFTVTDFERDLKEVSSQTRRWELPKESDLESFLTEKLKQPYEVGTGFFEIMKREGNVKADRQLMILVPDTGRTFIDGKRSVRSICGYPETGDLAIKPGNHAGFVVLGQSKSSKEKTFRARILPRGTKVVYYPGAVR